MSDYGTAPYGYASQGARHSISGGGAGRVAVPASSGYGAGPAAVSPGGIARVDRSSAINDYVLKQKQAKQNAPLLRKVSEA